jgi:hypothetical protein
MEAIQPLYSAATRVVDEVEFFASERPRSLRNVLVHRSVFQPKRGESRFARLVIRAEHDDKITGSRLCNGIIDQTGCIGNVIDQSEMNVQIRLNVTKVGNVFKSRSFADDDVDRFPAGMRHDQVASDSSDDFACDFHKVRALNDSSNKLERDDSRFFRIGRNASVAQRTSAFRGLTYEQSRPSVNRHINFDNALLAACDRLHGRTIRACATMLAYGAAIGCVWFLCIAWRAGAL